MISRHEAFWESWADFFKFYPVQQSDNPKLGGLGYYCTHFYHENFVFPLFDFDLSAM